jgi:uncharacterized membrane protein YidH (DUF202 family)
MVDPARPTIPGLQRERTALAWDRTGVAFLLAGLLFLRATGGASLWWRIPSVLTVVFGSLLMLYGYRRYARAAVGPAGGPLGTTGLLRVVGLVAIAFSLASAALIVVRF